MRDAAAANRRAKRDVIVISDDETKSEQPAVKSARMETESPLERFSSAAESESAELRRKLLESDQKLLESNEKLEKSEQKFQRLCIMAGEHKARVQFLENIIDTKPNIAGDANKDRKIEELEKKVIGLSKQLEEEQKGRRSDNERNEMRIDKLTREREAERMENTELRKKLAHLTKRVAPIGNEDTINKMEPTASKDAAPTAESDDEEDEDEDENEDEEDEAPIAKTDPAKKEEPAVVKTVAACFLDTTLLSVRNIAGAITVAELKTIFKTASDIKIPNPKGQMDNYALVRFESEEEARNVFNASQTLKINGAPATVMFAFTRATVEKEPPPEKKVKKELKSEDNE